MRALEFITGHVIYNPAYTYKFQLKTTKYRDALVEFHKSFDLWMNIYMSFRRILGPSFIRFIAFVICQWN